MKPMTVKMLIKLLEQLDPDALVMLSSDEEGNAISPFGGYGYDDKMPKDPSEIWAYNVPEEFIGKPYVILYPTL